jgi:hypothetical protein
MCACDQQKDTNGEDIHVSLIANGAHKGRMSLTDKEGGPAEISNQFLFKKYFNYLLIVS